MDDARKDAMEDAVLGRPVTIFVVEDSSLVMVALEGLFDDMGWTVEGPATGLADALAMAATSAADIALLDINLDGEESWPVAERLRGRGIPVVFATGYGGAADLPATLRDMPVINKPFAIVELEDILRGALGN